MDRLIAFSVFAACGIGIQFSKSHRALYMIQTMLIILYGRPEWRELYGFMAALTGGMVGFHIASIWSRNE